MVGMVDELKTPIVNSSGAAGSSGVAQNAAATYALARLLVGSATGDTLYVFGRTTQSDGGQGLFTWVAGGTTTVNDGSQLSATGGIWQRPDATLNAAWYGIDPTGVADSAPGINLAIQDAILRKLKLFLPAGIFLLNSPLLCFTTGSSGQTRVDIEGQGGAVPNGPGLSGSLSSFMPNTLLFANYITKPAIIFQNNRNSKLSNLAIQGKNTTPYQSPAIPTNNTADYILAGCAVGLQSPYAGIAIDPFTTSVPADGGYAGMGAYYGAGPANNGSSGIVFENVFIQEFVVGVALSTAGVLVGDSMVFKNLQVFYCDTGWVCGNQQSRNVTISGGSIYGCRQAFDTINYGTAASTACNPIVIENMILSQLYRVFALDNTAPCTIKSIYTESIKTLGQFGTGSGGNPAPVSFLGCHCAIRDSWGNIPPLFFESFSSTIFKGCYFVTDSATCDVWNIYCSYSGQSGAGSFEKCFFTGSSQSNIPPIIAADLNIAGGARFIDCWSNSSAAGVILITDVYKRTSAISSYNAGIGRLRATYQTREVMDGVANRYFYTTPDGLWIGINTTASITIVSNTLTFTISTLGEIQVGDILIWMMLAQGKSVNQRFIPAWKVTSVTAGTGACVATAVYDIAQYDTVANTAANLGANVVLVVPHQWAPTQALTGNTHTNTTLDGIAPTALLNGDFLYGSGIPNKTRVVSGGGTASVVLSKAATATASGVTLYYGRLLAPTTTVAF